MKKRKSVIKDLKLRRKIRSRFKKGMEYKDIAKDLDINIQYVCMYIEEYKKQQIVNGKKYCHRCWNWKLFVFENFWYAWTTNVAGEKKLNSTCRECRSRIRKNERIMNTPYVQKEMDISFLS